MQARLAQQERDLQAEIDVLREELRKDQDPSRMQLIQEMISVRLFAPVPFHVCQGLNGFVSCIHHCIGPSWADVSHTGEGY